MRASQANHRSSKEPSVSKFSIIFLEILYLLQHWLPFSFVLISQFLLLGTKIQHNQFKFSFAYRLIPALSRFLSVPYSFLEIPRKNPVFIRITLSCSLFRRFMMLYRRLISRFFRFLIAPVIVAYSVLICFRRLLQSDRFLIS